MCRVLLASLVLGASIMAAGAQDKEPPKPKGRPKEPLKSPYVEYVVVRPYYKGTNGFINPWDHVQAYRDKDREGKDRINLKLGGLMLEAKSEITDADGNVYEVLQVVSFAEKEGSPRACYVKKIKDGKKPEPAKEEPPPKKPAPTRGRASGRRRAINSP